MSALLEKLRSEARGLSVEERYLLAMDLLDSAGDPHPPEADESAAWEIEMARRTGELLQGGVPAVPWSRIETDFAREFGWKT